MLTCEYALNKEAGHDLSVLHLSMQRANSWHAGLCYATIGNAFYARKSDAPGHAQPVKAQQLGFTNVESELRNAISVAYGGDAYARSSSVPSTHVVKLTSCAGSCMCCHASHNTSCYSLHLLHQPGLLLSCNEYYD